MGGRKYEEMEVRKVGGDEERVVVGTTVSVSVELVRRRARWR